MSPICEQRSGPRGIGRDGESTAGARPHPSEAHPPRAPRLTSRAVAATSDGRRPSPAPRAGLRWLNGFQGFLHNGKIGRPRRCLSRRRVLCALPQERGGELRLVASSEHGKTGEPENRRTGELGEPGPLCSVRYFNVGPDRRTAVPENRRLEV